MKACAVAFVFCTVASSAEEQESLSLLQVGVKKHGVEPPQSCDEAKGALMAARQERNTAKKSGASRSDMKSLRRAVRAAKKAKKGLCGEAAPAASGGAQYTFGITYYASCPYGSNAITSEDECRAAAIAVDKGDFQESGDYSNKPPACSYDNSGVFFNTNAVGGKGPTTVPICTVDPNIQIPNPCPSIPWEGAGLRLQGFEVMQCANDDGSSPLSYAWGFQPGQPQIAAQSKCCSFQGGAGFNGYCMVDAPLKWLPGREGQWNPTTPVAPGGSFMPCPDFVSKA